MAVAAAHRAAPVMREMTLDQRASILRKVSEKVLAKRDELATALSS